MAKRSKWNRQNMACRTFTTFEQRQTGTRVELMAATKFFDWRKFRVTPYTL